MKVTLLAHTILNPDLPADHPLRNDASTPQESLVEYAGRVCYKSDDKMGHNPTFVRLRIREGHEDIIEHSSATFQIEGVSRPCSHQIMRHRIASYSQESQRYVSLDKGGWGVVVPPAIASDPEAAAIVAELWENMQSAYERLRARGIRKEDARYFLPLAVETKFVMTMNFRSLRHFFWQRLDKAAQWEVRAVAVEMLKLVYSLAPTVFADFAEHLNDRHHNEVPR